MLACKLIAHIVNGAEEPIPGRVPLLPSTKLGVTATTVDPEGNVGIVMFHEYAVLMLTTLPIGLHSKAPALVVSVGPVEAVKAKAAVLFHI